MVKDLSVVRKLSDVNFGTAADLDHALPGFVTAGFYFVDVVPRAPARGGRCSKRPSS